jgi:hypothetical protein
LLILLLGFDLDYSAVFSLLYGRAGEKKLTVHAPLWRQAIDGTSSRFGILTVAKQELNLGVLLVELVKGVFDRF